MQPRCLYFKLQFTRRVCPRLLGKRDESLLLWTGLELLAHWVYSYSAYNSKGARELQCSSVPLLMARGVSECAGIQVATVPSKANQANDVYPSTLSGMRVA